jgi:hypothetical protein
MSDKPVLRPWVRGVFVSARLCVRTVLRSPYLRGNGYPQGFPDVFVSVFPHRLSVSQLWIKHFALAFILKGQFLTLANIAHMY